MKAPTMNALHKAQEAAKREYEKTNERKYWALWWMIEACICMDLEMDINPDIRRAKKHLRIAKEFCRKAA